MTTETKEEIDIKETFDESYHHIAQGPPFITTLCGINIQGQKPRENRRKPKYPICLAREKFGLT